LSALPPTRSPTSSVARYYDRNTRRFLLVGRAGQSYGIHRQLWGPGVTKPEDAANYVNLLLEEEIRARVGDASTPALPASTAPHPPAQRTLTILDLGCGVGGTLFHLARAFPDSQLIGVTISRQQLEIAEKLSAQEHLQDRVRVEQADFHTMHLGVEADVAIAVESFAHSDAPPRFFKSVAAHLREGGHLLVVDDFLYEDEGLLSDAQRRLVEDFRRGWHVRSVCSVELCVRAAAELGLQLERNADLSPLIRLGRLRDRLIARLSPAFTRLRLAGIPFFDNMMGGHALQEGLRAGFLEHRMLTFRKRA
jgi:SAM-dependent methyltransferase